LLDSLLQETENVFCCKDNCCNSAVPILLAICLCLSPTQNRSVAVYE